MTDQDKKQVDEMLEKLDKNIELIEYVMEHPKVLALYDKMMDKILGMKSFDKMLERQAEKIGSAVAEAINKKK